MAIQRIPGGQLLPESCLCLGNFDGIHRGHQAIVKTCLAKAAAKGLPCVVWTFAKHPGAFLSGEGFRAILSRDDKATLLEEMGVDTMVEEEFLRVRDLSPVDFCRKILLEEMNAREVVCGFNFRFGKNGAGGARDLKRELEPAGVSVTVVDPVKWNGEAISSTRIRQALSQGDMAACSAMLGRPYFIRFPVTEGKHLGTRLGFPTVNQAYPADYTVPRHGVYAVTALVNGKILFGVCNVGRRPTVEPDGPITAETHLFDFDGDLYGRQVTVCFQEFLRPEKQFGSLEQLREQIERDKEAAKQVLAAMPPME